MNNLQQTYRKYLEKRELLEQLDQVTLAEIQQKQTAIAVQKTIRENLFPSWALSKAYKETHGTDLKNDEIGRLNTQERSVQLGKEALLQEIIALQNILPSIVLLTSIEVDSLESLVESINYNLKQIEVILPDLEKTIIDSNKKANTSIVAEGADLVVENRKRNDSKGLWSRGVDFLSTILSQRTFETHDQINGQLQRLNPLVDEVNNLVKELNDIEKFQTDIDHRKKPVKNLPEIKDYRVVEYVDLLQDFVFPNTKYDVGSALSIIIQGYVKGHTKDLSTGIKLLKNRLDEVKRGCAKVTKEISLYRTLTNDEDTLQLNPLP